MIRPAQDKQPDERGVRERGADRLRRTGPRAVRRCLSARGSGAECICDNMCVCILSHVKILLPMQIAVLLVEDPQYNFLPKTIKTRYVQVRVYTQVTLK